MEPTDKLLPCPFCGGEARVFHYSSAIRDEVWRAVCDKPFCAQGPDGYTEAEAIAAWNTRAEMSYEDALILLDELGLSERTCKMRADGAHCMNGVEFYECRSCGEYACIPTVMGKSEPPNYCPNCGAKVVGE